MVSIVVLSHTGISVCRVTKPSKIPATNTIGNMPRVIFMPSSAPRLKDANRLYVLGKIRLLPKIKPAPPAIIIDEISNVPCIHITNIDCIPSPLLKKKYWNEPNIIAFRIKINKVPTEKNAPATKLTTVTVMLFLTIWKNIINES